MSKVFFISDLHFGHTNIIRYENRPYPDAATMDQDLVVKWNTVVQPEDTVWFLGDLALGCRKDYLKSLVRQLNGHKKMIRGNHDKWTDSSYRELGFEYVSRYPVVLLNHFILSHAPLPVMTNDSTFFYVYGHVHSSSAYATTTDNSRCVCCERQNYTPIEIPEFNKYLKAQEVTK